MKLNSVVCFCLATGLFPSLPAKEYVSPPVPAGHVANFGINLAPVVDWTTEFPFVDLLKMSRQWISQRKDAWDSKEPLDIDSNGYVKSLLPGQWATTLMATEAGQIVPPGRYTFFYEGEGEVSWEGIATKVDSSPGRDMIEITRGDAPYVKMTIKSLNPSNPLRNMRLIRSGHEDTYAEQPFSPEFLALWKSAGTFRFMDWMRTNNATENKTWADRTLPGDVRYTGKSGVPLEVMIALCNATGSNGWFCIPHLADDDYIRKMAALIFEKLDPSLVANFEFSNEVWNSMFSQTQWAEKQGMAEGLGNKPWEAGWAHYSKDCRRMADIVDEVFASAPQRRRRIVSSQAANTHIVKQILGHSDVAAHCDAISIAPYVTFNVPPEGKNGQPGAAEVAAWSLDQLFAHIRDVCLPDSISRIDKHAEVARDFKLDLVAYEGGQHLNALGEAQNNKQLIELLCQANRDPRMGAIYTDYLDHWTRAGGKLHNLFNSVGRYGRYGFWGLLETVTQDPATAPKYQAVLKWANSREQVNATAGSH
ncbi:MAG: hypothetical protein WCH98_00880 [Verrucomicrobiota bacterium]